MLDAMAGYNEADNNRIKSLASIVRTATTKLWNTQIVEKDRLTDEELWPLPWEQGSRTEPSTELTPEEKEEYKQNADLQAEYLIKHFPDGNSNKQS